MWIESTTVGLMRPRLRRWWEALKAIEDRVSLVVVPLFGGGGRIKCFGKMANSEIEFQIATNASLPSLMKSNRLLNSIISCFQQGALQMSHCTFLIF